MLLISSFPVDVLPSHSDACHYHIVHCCRGRACRGVQSVVVEVKNRTRQGTFDRAPSLADQIQLVCYCLMLGTSEGDLVQALRERKAEVRLRQMCILLH